MILLWVYATILIMYSNFEPTTEKFLNSSQVLFIHIPKTGGNSIKQTNFFKSCSYFGHTYIRDVKHANMYKYSFAIVRNPYDRLVSAYFYLKKGGMPNNSYDLQMQKRLKKYTYFKDFVRDLKLFVNDTHFKPQHMFVCDSGGRIIVNHILKVENIDNEFSQLLRSKLLPDEKLHTINASKHDNYTRYYDDNEIKKRVYTIYERDFELFDYHM